MTQDPLVSIVILCYNYGHFIEEAIASVEECRAATYELIMVDDGSTDEATVKAMTELKAAGYRLITQRNKGLGAARSAVIAAARGMYILPLDSDNKIRAGFVERAAKILDERLDIGIVYGDFQYFGEADALCRVPQFDIKKMLYQNIIDACALYRKKVWEDCGGYDTQMPVQGIEDWDFWLKAYTRARSRISSPATIRSAAPTHNSPLRPIATVLLQPLSARGRCKHGQNQFLKLSITRQRASPCCSRCCRRRSDLPVQSERKGVYRSGIRCSDSVSLCRSARPYCPWIVPELRR